MMPIKCDVKCDNIVKGNLIDLTSKNPILINEK
jgi:SUMO ligase MMS21 Smc5/6 complex component